MSIRQSCRLASAFSVLDSSVISSTISFRSFCRSGSSFSFFGAAQVGSVRNMSVVGLCKMSSSVSIRSFVQMGA
jgi:hypothetical protein